MSDVEFIDNSIKVQNAIEDAIGAFLEEASGELESQVKRNMDKLSGQWYSQQKNAWQHIVDESKGEAVVGNPMEQMLWTEFGTGEYAANGDGRKGYWVYVKGSGGGASSGGGDGKSYTLEEAKKIVAMMRSDGLDAYMTKGQKPKRSFETAYNNTKPKINKLAEQVFKSKLSD